MNIISLRAVIPRTLATVIIAIATSHAFADDAAVNSTDKSFIQNAYEDGLAEVKMAEMAQGKTANADVKAFAEKMATDHGQADTQLKTLADSKKSPSPPNPLSPPAARRSCSTPALAAVSTRITPVTWSALTRVPSKPSKRR